MNQEDFQALKAPLLVLLAVLLAGGLSIYYSDQIRKAARQQFAQQEKQLKEARTRVQKSGDEKEVIVQYLDSFRQLERAGFVGEEQRINWLDGLRVANQQADLFGVDYQIGTQAAYAYSPNFNPGQVTLNQSIMRLNFKLLHEVDLMRFFAALSRQGSGIFTLDQCILRRIDTRGVIRYQPNVNAECELSWITAQVAAQTAAPGETAKPKP
jgi:hypothetical protein